MAQPDYFPTPRPGCATCGGLGVVCENHPQHGWAGLCCDAVGACPHGRCGCGAGDPCVTCWEADRAAAGH